MIQDQNYKKDLIILSCSLCVSVLITLIETMLIITSECHSPTFYMFFGLCIFHDITIIIYIILLKFCKNYFKKLMIKSIYSTWISIIMYVVMLFNPMLGECYKSPIYGIIIFNLILSLISLQENFKHYYDKTTSFDFLLSETEYLI